MYGGNVSPAIFFGKFFKDQDQGKVSTRKR